MLQNAVSLGEPELCGMNLAQAHTHLKTVWNLAKDLGYNSGFSPFNCVTLYMLFNVYKSPVSCQ